MPGIRFADVRARVTMVEVLGLIGFVPSETSGDQVRGPCPVPRSDTSSGRSFSSNLRLHIYRCFKCGSSGNHLDLYASVTGLSLFDAAVELCERLHREIPWAVDMSPSRPRATDRSEAGRRARPRLRDKPSRSAATVERIAPQPLRWHPLARKSCAQPDRNRQRRTVTCGITSVNWITRRIVGTTCRSAAE